MVPSRKGEKKTLLILDTYIRLNPFAYPESNTLVDSINWNMIDFVNLLHGSTNKKRIVHFECYDPNHTCSHYLIIGFVDSPITISSSRVGGYNSSEVDNLNIVIHNSSRSYSFRMVRGAGLRGRPFEIDFKVK